MPTPLTALRIDPAEKAELQRLAAERGVTLTEAFKKGARMFLEAKEPAKSAV